MDWGTWRGAGSIFAVVVVTALGQASMVSAEVFTAGPSEDIEVMINALQPGDELVLAGGTYTPQVTAPPVCSP